MTFVPTRDHWRTDNALAPEPAWQFVSQTFEHQNVAALALDPNDATSQTLWAGTGEPNACGSGCTAGVGLDFTSNGGHSWKGTGGQPATATFTSLDGDRNNGYGDIPAASIIVSQAGTIYVGNDFGVVTKEKGSSVWRPAAAGLPNVTVADLVYVSERGVLYAGTHGQGVWQLKVQ